MLPCCTPASENGVRSGAGGAVQGGSVTAGPWGCPGTPLALQPLGATSRTSMGWWWGRKGLLGNTSAAAPAHWSWAAGRAVAGRRAGTRRTKCRKESRCWLEGAKRAGPSISITWEATSERDQRAWICLNHWRASGRLAEFLVKLPFACFFSSHFKMFRGYWQTF